MNRRAVGSVFGTVLFFTTPGLFARGGEIVLEAPEAVPRFDPAEFTLKLQQPPAGNPFTDVEFHGDFTPPGGSAVRVLGFADAQDGRIHRLRFAPDHAGKTYRYVITFRVGQIDRRFEGLLRCEASDHPGPVIVDPEHPKHFIHAGSRRPFYHLGFTAYHLLDPSNDDAQVDATIDYSAGHGFNKIRFLLAGYPRDTDRRSSDDPEHGVPDPWKAPNYGSLPGQVNPLPAWVGKPHRYDFTRFNVSHWQRVERAIRRMRSIGIVATCIVTIEKQGLPREYGSLTEHEHRLYRYAVARLAAFDNVWWDLGNEHNEYRDRAWADAMGAYVKETDPFDRPASAHGYADFVYGESPWADFIITQQYGDEKAVHNWVLKYASTPKPYVNEEYGYEGSSDKPGHAQNGDWVRRCHWSIAMAGGYATYGDWSGGVSYFYMGEPGKGKAAQELKHLRAFFESLPFRRMAPRDELSSNGFCLAAPPRHYIFYLPRGGEAEIDLRGAAGPRLRARWYDPRRGNWRPGPDVKPEKVKVRAPGGGDWVLLVEGSSS